MYLRQYLLGLCCWVPLKMRTASPRSSVVIIFLWLSTSCRGLQQKLHRLALPLVGGPPWLRLHEAAVFEDAESGSLLLLDFLPAAPEAIETAIDLLTLGTVEGVVRTKALTRIPRVGTITETIPTPGHCDVETVARRMEATYDRRLSLISNNCRTFVEAVVQEVQQQQQQ